MAHTHEDGFKSTIKIDLTAAAQEQLGSILIITGDQRIKDAVLQENLQLAVDEMFTHIRNEIRHNHHQEYEELYGELEKILLENGVSYR